QTLHHEDILWPGHSVSLAVCWKRGPCNECRPPGQPDVETRLASVSGKQAAALKTNAPLIFRIEPGCVASELDFRPPQKLHGVEAVLALEVHLVGGIGLQREGVVEAGRVAKFDIRLGLLVGQ